MAKQVDRDAYRRELSRKAFAMFAEKGYGNLSMKDLSRGLEISSGLLYHYFEGKEDFFMQMVQESVRQLLTELSEQVSSDSTLDEKVHAIFDHMGKREKEFQLMHLALHDFIRLIGIEDFQNSPVISALIKQHFEYVQDALHISREQAVVLVTYATGVLVIGFILPSRTPLHEHERILMNMLRNSQSHTSESHSPQSGEK